MRKVLSPSLSALCVSTLLLAVFVVVGSSTAANAGGYLGRPPLSDHGGPVMGTNITPGAVTVTPIYWDPANTFSTSYKSVINGFFTNVAADSGKTTNVFSTDLQYGINYDVQAGTPIVDSDAFPASGCTPDTGAIYSDTSGYTSCLTDAQIQSELATVQAADSLPADLADLYLVFLPEGVESCMTSADGAQDGSCTENDLGESTFCGYHSYLSSGPLIYADMPFPIYNSETHKTCSPQAGPGNESPNGELDADVELSWVSAEMNGAITDPEGTAWYDRKGKEIDDDCRFIYGDVLGGTTPGGLYNQTINGAHYFLQEEIQQRELSIPTRALVHPTGRPSSRLVHRPPEVPVRGPPGHLQRSQVQGRRRLLRVELRRRLLGFGNPREPHLQHGRLLHRHAHGHRPQRAARRLQYRHEGDHGSLKRGRRDMGPTTPTVPQDRGGRCRHVGRNITLWRPRPGQRHMHHQVLDRSPLTDPFRCLPA